MPKDNREKSRLPIHQYDELPPSEIRERLNDLRPADVERLYDYEQSHQRRPDVLDALRNVTFSTADSGKTSWQRSAHEPDTGREFAD